VEFLKDEDIKESEKFVCKEVGLMYMAAKAIKRFLDSGGSIDDFLEDIEKCCVKKEGK
jgi:hypothetical protein